MVLHTNLKSFVGPDGFRLFDNPTVKKGIAVMFWIFVWQFFLLKKLPDFWEMNPRTFGLPISKYASTQRKIAIRTTTVPSTIVPCKNRGIYPSDRGIYPMTTGIKLDLCFCTIPTVGFYGKHGEVSISLFVTIY